MAEPVFDQNLTRAERLGRAATITIEVVDPESEPAAQALASYFAELERRFPTGFDSASAGAGHDAHLLRAPVGVFVVMREEGAVVGCGGVQRVDQHTGEIKRMWIHDEWRALGLGRRLLAFLETAVLGLDLIVLDTNASLHEAIAMYHRAGYRAVERYNDNPYAHHWFAKDVGGDPNLGAGAVPPPPVTSEEAHP